jgi:hypothetical protein
VAAAYGGLEAHDLLAVGIRAVARMATR